jgi:2-polyprenyl-3-methyl-5-hydroxy-6-metoxy-1,4-benzoquinol methylase
LDEIYNEHYFEKNWFKYPNLSLYKTIENTLNKRLGKEANIHDLGCGNGNFLQYIYELGYRNLSGSDIVSCLKKEIDGKVNFIHSSFDSIEGDQTYDFVISIANIEHVSDVHKYSNVLMEMLKPGGIAAIYTINEKALIYKISRFLRFFKVTFASKQMYDPHHINHFSVKSLSSLFIRNNFKILKTYTSNYPLNSTDILIESPIIKNLILIVVSFINLLASISKSEVGQLMIIQKASKG